MFTLFLFLACSSSSQQPSSLQDGVIHVQSPATIGPAVPQAMGMKERVLSVFKATQEELVSCYLPALEIDPMQYGELIVGVDIRPDGTVSEAEIVFATIGDKAMQDCVLDRARSLAFPAHNRERIRASYPFLFTSDQTPNEVVRALKIRHGLLSPEPPGEGDLSPDAEPARGQEGWYETW